MAARGEERSPLTASLQRVVAVLLRATGKEAALLPSSVQPAGGVNARPDAAAIVEALATLRLLVDGSLDSATETEALFAFLRRELEYCLPALLMSLLNQSLAAALGGSDSAAQVLSAIVHALSELGSAERNVLLVADKWEQESEASMVMLLSLVADAARALPGNVVLLRHAALFIGNAALQPAVQKHLRHVLADSSIFELLANAVAAPQATADVVDTGCYALANLLFTVESLARASVPQPQPAPGALRAPPKQASTAQLVDVVLRGETLPRLLAAIRRVGQQAWESGASLLVNLAASDIDAQKERLLENGAVLLLVDILREASGAPSAESAREGAAVEVPLAADASSLATSSRAASTVPNPMPHSAKLIPTSSGRRRPPQIIVPDAAERSSGSTPRTTSASFRFGGDGASPSRPPLELLSPRPGASLSVGGAAAGAASIPLSPRRLGGITSEWLPPDRSVPTLSRIRSSTLEAHALRAMPTGGVGHAPDSTTATSATARAPMPPSPCSPISDPARESVSHCCVQALANLATLRSCVSVLLRHRVISSILLVLRTPSASSALCERTILALAAACAALPCFQPGARADAHARCLPEDEQRAVDETRGLLRSACAAAQRHADSPGVQAALLQLMCNLAVAYQPVEGSTSAPMRSFSSTSSMAANPASSGNDSAAAVDSPAAESTSSFFQNLDLEWIGHGLPLLMALLKAAQTDVAVADMGVNVLAKLASGSPALILHAIRLHSASVLAALALTFNAAQPSSAFAPTVPAVLSPRPRVRSPRVNSSATSSALAPASATDGRRPRLQRAGTETATRPRSQRGGTGSTSLLQPPEARRPPLLPQVAEAKDVDTAEMKSPRLTAQHRASGFPPSALMVDTELGGRARSPQPSPNARAYEFKPSALLHQIMLVLARFCEAAARNASATARLLQSRAVVAAFAVADAHVMEEDLVAAALSLAAKMLRLPTVLDSATLLGHNSASDIRLTTNASVSSAHKFLRATEEVAQLLAGYSVATLLQVNHKRPSSLGLATTGAVGLPSKACSASSSPPASSLSHLQSPVSSSPSFVPSVSSTSSSANATASSSSSSSSSSLLSTSSFSASSPPLSSHQYPLRTTLGRGPVPTAVPDAAAAAAAAVGSSGAPSTFATTDAAASRSRPGRNVVALALESLAMRAEGAALSPLVDAAQRLCLAFLRALLQALSLLQMHSQNVGRIEGTLSATAAAAAETARVEPGAMVAIDADRAEESAMRVPEETVGRILEEALSSALITVSPLLSDPSLAARALAAVATIMVAAEGAIPATSPAAIHPRGQLRDAPTQPSLQHADPSLPSDLESKRSSADSAVHSLKLEVLTVVESIHGFVATAQTLPSIVVAPLRRAVAFFKTRVRMGASDRWKLWLEKKYEVRALRDRYLLVAAPPSQQPPASGGGEGTGLPRAESVASKEATAVVETKMFDAVASRNSGMANEMIADSLGDDGEASDMSTALVLSNRKALRFTAQSALVLRARNSPARVQVGHPGGGQSAMGSHEEARAARRATGPAASSEQKDDGKKERARGRSSTGLLSFKHEATGSSDSLRRRDAAETLSRSSSRHSLASRRSQEERAAADNGSAVSASRSNPPRFHAQLGRRSSLPSLLPASNSSTDLAHVQRRRGGGGGNGSSSGLPAEPTGAAAAVATSSDTPLGLPVGAHVHVRMSMGELPPLPPPRRGAQETRAAWFDLLVGAEAASNPAEYLRQQPEAEALMQRGVPAELRGRVWQILSGASALRRLYATDYYARVVANLHSVAEESAPWRDEIQKDVPRTLVNLPHFRTAEGRAALERVLSAYVVCNPETVGYCQSMNLLCGALLTQMDEESAFWVLSAVIEARMGYYSRSMCGLKVDQRVLGDLVAFHLPELDDHLRALQVSIATFAVPWFLCLFMENPFSIADGGLAFWDHLFFCGDELLFSTALQLLRRAQPALLAQPATEDVLDLLLHGGLSRGVDVGALVRELEVGALVEEVTALRELHQAELVRQRPKLDAGTAEDLTAKLGFSSAEEVRQLWNRFLEPAPWPILLTGCIANVVWFQQAFCPAVFPQWHCRRWRDRGLFSRVLHRLFDTLDVSETGRLSFEKFLAGVRIMTRGSRQERLALCFRFFDLDGDGFVSAGELTQCFAQLHVMYSGHSAAGAAARDGAALFSRMMIDRVQALRASTLSAVPDRPDGNMTPAPEDALAPDEFARVIGWHPLTQLFFGLERKRGRSVLGRRLREMSRVDRAVAGEAGELAHSGDLCDVDERDDGDTDGDGGPDEDEDSDGEAEGGASGKQLSLPASASAAAHVQSPQPASPSTPAHRTSMLFGAGH